MEHLASPNRFYNQLNQLVDLYQTTSQEENLNQISSLIKRRFEKRNLDVSLESEQLTDLKNRLIKLEVPENHSIINVIQETLGSPKTVKSGLEGLPQEIIFHILSFLKGKEWKKLEQTDASFFILTHPLIQTILIEEFIDKLTTEEILKLAQYVGPSVTHLNLRNREFTEQELDSLLQAFPNVQTLDLSFCDLLIGDNKEKKSISDKELKSIGQLKNLQTLILNGAYGITNEGLKSIEGLSNLRNLDLTFQISDEGLKSIAKLTKLQTLSLVAIRISNDGLKLIENLSDLQALKLYMFGEIKDDGLKPLENLSNLQTLHMSGISQITNKGLESFVKLHNLKSLGFTSNDHIDDEGMKQIEKSSLKLESLNIIDCTKITGEGWNLSGTEVFILNAF